MIWPNPPYILWCGTSFCRYIKCNLWDLLPLRTLNISDTVCANPAHSPHFTLSLPRPTVSCRCHSGGSSVVIPLKLFQLYWTSKFGFSPWGRPCQCPCMVSYTAYVWFNFYLFHCILTCRLFYLCSVSITIKGPCINVHMSSKCSILSLWALWYVSRWICLGYIKLLNFIYHPLVSPCTPPQFHRKLEKCRLQVVQFHPVFETTDCCHSHTDWTKHWPNKLFPHCSLQDDLMRIVLSFLDGPCYTNLKTP
jgi:hypothetical protein